MKQISQNKPSSRLNHSARLLLILALLISIGACSLLKKKEVDTEQLSAEVLYGAAKDALLREKWLSATEKLRVLEARYPYGRFGKQALLDTAFAHYKMGEDHLAIAAADRFIALNPIHPTVDYAYYIKGLANFKEVPGIRGLVTGRTNLASLDPQSVIDAINAFTIVAQRYPNSTYAHDSKKRLQYLESARAKHEVGIAHFYFERGAYVAAANRAKSVLSVFGSLPEAEDALGIMYHSYQQMNMTDLALDTKRVLELNYPESGYLKPRVPKTSKMRFLSRWFNQS